MSGPGNPTPTDVTVTDLRLLTTWTDRACQATACRSGRVLLAGDATHIHSPLDGQGLNLGLGDAGSCTSHVTQATPLA